MNRLKELLKEFDISKNWAAKKLGKNCSKQRFEDLFRVAKKLGVNAKDLLKDV